MYFYEGVNEITSILIDKIKNDFKTNKAIGVFALSDILDKKYSSQIIKNVNNAITFYLNNVKIGSGEAVSLIFNNYVDFVINSYSEKNDDETIFKLIVSIYYNKYKFDSESNSSHYCSIIKNHVLNKKDDDYKLVGAIDFDILKYVVNEIAPQISNEILTIYKKYTSENIATKINRIYTNTNLKLNYDVFVVNNKLNIIDPNAGEWQITPEKLFDIDIDIKIKDSK